MSESGNVLSWFTSDRLIHEIAESLGKFLLLLIELRSDAAVLVRGLVLWAMSAFSIRLLQSV